MCDIEHDGEGARGIELLEFDAGCLRAHGAHHAIANCHQFFRKSPSVAAAYATDQPRTHNFSPQVMRCERYARALGRSKDSGWRRDQFEIVVESISGANRGRWA